MSFYSCGLNKRTKNFCNHTKMRHTRTSSPRSSGAGQKKCAQMNEAKQQKNQFRKYFQGARFVCLRLRLLYALKEKGATQVHYVLACDCVCWCPKLPENMCKDRFDRLCSFCKIERRFEFVVSRDRSPLRSHVKRVDIEESTTHQAVTNLTVCLKT